jgi:predicted Zn finger-like uncharacterized protein
MFRVVPDQLKISEGWVRCGHCGEVFDATTHMTDSAPLEPEPTTQSAVPQAEKEAAAAPAQPAPAEPAPARPVPLRPPSTLNEPPEAEEIDSELDESPLDQPFVFRRSDLVQADDLPSVTPPTTDSIPTLPSRFREEEEDDEDDPELRDVSFVRQARRRAWWSLPRVRLLLAIAVVVLAGLLSAQMALHDRDRLAAGKPGLRPWLQTMCAALGCSIGAPRQIESLSIESSSFNKLRSDTYRLSFTVKNNATVETAMPAMELTLTDTQDQPVVRRVLAPADLHAPAPVIAPGAEWSGSVAIVVDANGAGGRISGYRLLAFYP